MKTAVGMAAALLVLAGSLQAQSVVAGYEVQPWATVTDPVDLAAASDGTLYVGRDATGSGGGPGDAVAIHKVDPNGSVTPYGPAIADPDTVFIDTNGDVDVPGSVLVGSSVASLGQIVAVDDQQNATVLFGPSATIVNPSGLAIEDSGALLATDFDQGTVFRFVNLVPSIVFSAIGSPLDIVVEPSTGNLIVSWVDGGIRSYSPTGTLLDADVGNGRGLALHPETGDLWTVDNATGQLHRIQSNGVSTVIGSGFEKVWGMDFDGNGNLFITEFDNDRILRVREVGIWTDFGGGSLGIAGQPTLTGSGTLLGGTAAGVSLTNAPASAPMLAWISFAPTPFMALGGTVHAFPFASQLFVFADAAGEFSASTTWPAAIPAGTGVTFQFIVQDLSVPDGLTLSNGLRATTP